MADNFLQSFKNSFTLSDIDSQIEFNDQFPGLNCDQDISALNIHSLMGSFPHDTFFPQLSDHCPGNNNLENTTTFPGLFIHEDTNTMAPPLADHPVISNENDRKDGKRKAMEIITPESSSANSYSAQSSDNGIIRKTNSAKKGKKVKVDETPREVVHVRAKRGQATDSHSLAERVRRGKINERLRCLQDIVPGCYKTMGMAVMLDEIINYVQSLQNQVEFLSMRLTAANTFYDVNDMDAMETIQRAKGFEAMKIDNVGMQGLPSAQFDPLDLNFGCYPHNR
ncbi:hypothetical protein BUALT_Bualt02G0180000 [Buddleja alternifolia]|uniref:BHLH domain-containing protein n=1 Tax=Buddleja alternifolia TaxID=168488 RepID=A0AAV6Y2D6_9LAMI|nr:hypothetical protein BUALT_Bualt02G0180000 [Buddleja alternifolia]